MEFHLECADMSASRLGGTASSRRSPYPKVAFFFKQWGGVRKSETGRELDGETYDEFPERRQTSVPDLEFRRNALLQLKTKPF